MPWADLNATAMKLTCITIMYYIILMCIDVEWGQYWTGFLQGEGVKGEGGFKHAWDDDIILNGVLMKITYIHYKRRLKLRNQQNACCCYM